MAAAVELRYHKFLKQEHQVGRDQSHMGESPTQRPCKFQDSCVRELWSSSQISLDSESFYGSTLPQPSKARHVALKKGAEQSESRVRQTSAE